MGRRSAFTQLGTLAAIGLALLGFAGWAHAHGTYHDRLAAASSKIEAHPDRAILYVERAHLYRGHRDFAEAMADLDRAEALDPELIDTDFMRGLVYLDLEEPENADTALSRVLTKSPEHVAALEARGRTRMLLGRYLAAARDYDLAIAHQATPQPEPYLVRARALAAAGDEHLPEAIAGLDAGLARMGPAVTLEQAALQLELQMGATDAALERLDRTAARSPRKDTWLARRGQILEGAGRDAEARRSYEEALAALSKLPASRRRAAASRDLEGQIHEALERLSQKSVAGESSGP
ncbi:MAG: tetratricopeptide repeat protein [Deltaproteobacteria bacterium]|nr:tetratricopeptide repeat protein [Deltaproteobacteria bacterium]